ncbi:hypothetical protein [Hoeflea sp.]|uniref:hypothetical protein n=1 Tax=Hoeflea sp. TaxID=1940281 RepID=UPI003BAE27B0
MFKPSFPRDCDRSGWPRDWAGYPASLVAFFLSGSEPAAPAERHVVRIGPDRRKPAAGTNHGCGDLASTFPHDRHNGGNGTIGGVFRSIENQAFRDPAHDFSPKSCTHFRNQPSRQNSIPPASPRNYAISPEMASLTPRAPIAKERLCSQSF